MSSRFLTPPLIVTMSSVKSCLQQVVLDCLDHVLSKDVYMTEANARDRTDLALQQ